ncbi:cytochrome-c peroxidase [Hymenobacter oligotrophus]|uniref:Cytochrome-c peroxidase n=1 Tax=Hymenobacter oligotrophus TaxID=2319843 RepID=A0A3B7R9D7_9BACT|nr:cytochrome c peroxidase [Hymenobacter oligotrophus]AYA36246.1 cytochrome-c peroxidase [Hymenobacter oligotrophus]
MHRLTLALAALLFALVVGWSACQRPGSGPHTQAPASQALQQYLGHIRLFDADLLQLRQAVASNQPLKQQHAAFARARLQYKKLEYLAEYYSPSLAKLLNGPALVEVAEYDQTQRQIPPEGLQVVEGFLYPQAYAAGQRQLLLDQLDMMRSTVQSLQRAASTIALTDAHLFDAARLQLFRVLTLGLAGFDTPASPGAVAEAAASLSALETALRPYAQHRADRLLPLTQRFAAAQTYLGQHPNAANFDRLTFLTEYAHPLAREIWATQRALAINFFREARPLRPDAATLFEPFAFDANCYAPTPGQAATPAQIHLGQQLFFDPVLSGNGQRNCASCHRPSQAFADGLAKSLAFDGRSTVARNAPSLLNAALQRTQFYDGRVLYLEDQAAEVINNPNELHGSLSQAAQALNQHSAYRAAFAAAYPATRHQPLGEQHIKAALAGYVRSLVRLNAPFDRYVRGERQALSASAKRGFNVFMGKGKCGTCHFMPLFNGTVPPAFERSENEVLGVPAQASLHPRRLDADPGRQRILGIEWQRHAFKTPTVRNVALTAPYMHNGAYRTLEEVVEFYARGGGAGLGLNVPNQTLPFDKLELTATDKRDLVAFLHALTDTSGVLQHRALPGFGASPLAASAADQLFPKQR